LHIIPVIDLLDGVVVHAKQGLRAHYQAISSSLTASSRPVDIVKAFMDLYPFETLYIADLNAIQKIGLANKPAIAAIQNAFPQIKIWLDAGALEKQQLAANNNIQYILGTESLNNLDDYNWLKQNLTSSPVLSLDFLPDGYHGPITLLEDVNLWPEELIVMTLNQVGANAGFDSKTIASILARAQHQHVYAAGGVRNISDLISLKSMAVYGALVASALHSQQITAQDLASLTIKKPE
jgi:phosphoribosylformimino-5-aminoimidazole carboxamide ribotide isomerase